MVTASAASIGISIIGLPLISNIVFGVIDINVLLSFVQRLGCSLIVFRSGVFKNRVNISPTSDGLADPFESWIEIVPGKLPFGVFRIISWSNLNVLIFIVSEKVNIRVPDPTSKVNISRVGFIVSTIKFDACRACEVIMERTG